MIEKVEKCIAKLGTTEDRMKDPHGLLIRKRDNMHLADMERKLRDGGESAVNLVNALMRQISKEELDRLLVDAAGSRLDTTRRAWATVLQDNTLITPHAMLHGGTGDPRIDASSLGKAFAALHTFCLGRIQLMLETCSDEDFDPPTTSGYAVPGRRAHHETTQRQPAVGIIATEPSDVIHEDMVHAHLNETSTVEARTSLVRTCQICTHFAFVMGHEHDASCFAFGMGTDERHPEAADERVGGWQVGRH